MELKAWLIGEEEEEGGTGRALDWADIQKLEDSSEMGLR